MSFSILPKDGCSTAFQNLKRPETKKELKSFCGMLSSLQGWSPSVPLHSPLLRKSCGPKEKIVWTSEMLLEYDDINKLMLNQIKLSLYNEEKDLYLVIDGTSSVRTGFTREGERISLRSWILHY